VGVQALCELAANSPRKDAEICKQGYSANYVNSMKITASKIFSWAVKCGWLQSNPCKGLPIPKSGKKRIRHVLTAEQVRSLVAALPKREGVMVIFLAITGLRISEAVALRWSDFREDCIHMRRYRYEGRITELESRESRLVPIPIELRRLMESLRESEEDDWIFRSRTPGLPMNHSMSMKRIIKPVLRKLGLPSIGWHDLRHTLISWLGSAKYSPKMIADVVGHSDIQTTLSVYTHAAMPEVRIALDEIAGKLFRNCSESQ